MGKEPNVIIYKIDKDYLNRTRILLKEKLLDWYEFKQLDILVTISTLGDIGRLMIDCSNESSFRLKEITKLTNLFLDEFNIKYSYDYKFLA